MKCTWCGAEVAEDDGYRAAGPEGRAVFCRLEHVVPWEMTGAKWEQGGAEEGAAPDRIVLVRHRGEHRITEEFPSAAEMAAWAKAGGPWG